MDSVNIARYVTDPQHTTAFDQCTNAHSAGTGTVFEGSTSNLDAFRGSDDNAMSVTVSGCETSERGRPLHPQQRLKKRSVLRDHLAMPQSPIAVIYLRTGWAVLATYDAHVAVVVLARQLQTESEPVSPLRRDSVANAHEDTIVWPGLDRGLGGSTCRRHITYLVKELHVPSEVYVQNALVTVPQPARPLRAGKKCQGRGTPAVGM